LLTIQACGSYIVRHQLSKFYSNPQAHAAAIKKHWCIKCILNAQ
jgi:hypothetical protein